MTTPFVDRLRGRRGLVSLGVLALLVLSTWGIVAGAPAAPAATHASAVPQPASIAAHPARPVSARSVDARARPSVDPLVSTYELSFLEIGLAGGIPWSVTVTWSNGTATGTNTTNRTNPTNESNITFLLADGVYEYTVHNVTDYTSSPASGSITVNGTNLNLTITFGQKVEFFESGLPKDLTWSVEIGNLTETNRSTSGGGGILFVEPDGVYKYAVSSVSNGTFHIRVPSPAAGNVSVAGTNTFVTVGITYALETAYSVMFVASHLPPFMSWSVQSGLLNRTNSTLLLGHSNRTSRGDIQFSEPAGTMSFSISTPRADGYGVAKLVGANHPNLTSGDISGNTTWTVDFGALFNLSFNMSGLPQYELYPNASWGVTLTPSTTGEGPSTYNDSNNTTHNFTLPAGVAYRFTITGPSSYKILPSSGSVTMPDRNLNKTVRFKLIGEPIVFVEHGLDRGLNWTVTITTGTTEVYSFPLAMSRHGSGPLRFELPVGNYTYSISSSGNQTATPATGAITVHTAPSAARSIAITFS